MPTPRQNRSFCERRLREDEAPGSVLGAREIPGKSLSDESHWKVHILIRRHAATAPYHEF